MWRTQHSLRPDASFDGGDLDCGNGLLLLIRKHLDPLRPGQLLEIRSTEISVEEDLPAWARLTGNEILSAVRTGRQRSYLLRKGTANSREKEQTHAREPNRQAAEQLARPTTTSATISSVPEIRPLSVMGVGSWPRPRWMLQALHEYLEGRMPEAEFQQTADDAVQLAIAAQERAGVDVITDGEQRRDNYASFVGSRLDNCQLVPITDLLAYVDDPEKFAEELKALDVPANLVRHPAILGRLGRSRPLAVHELQSARSRTTKPIKVALPGPYLLTRTMWLECVSERVYTEREELAADIIRVLREEIRDLLDAGAAIVQLDEPVLTEVVFGRPQHNRTFMCGALGERRSSEEELAFAGRVLNEVLAGFPRSRMALHICRGNWSRDENVALRGDYTPLVPLLCTIEVGTYFLELCTPRAGEMEALRELPLQARLGVGVVNPKTDRVESDDEILAKAEHAIELFGPQRVLLNPDCGFATFADNPISSAPIAEAKLNAMVRVAAQLRNKYSLPAS